jgi:hypothetical protein
MALAASVSGGSDEAGGKQKAWCGVKSVSGSMAYGKRGGCLSSTRKQQWRAAKYMWRRSVSI